MPCFLQPHRAGARQVDRKHKGVSACKTQLPSQRQLHGCVFGAELLCTVETLTARAITIAPADTAAGNSSPS